MQKLGFPDFIINLIKDIYKDSTITLEVRGERSNGIKLKKGVKQGCPLSPVLFNIALDALLNGIERILYRDGFRY